MQKDEPAEVDPVDAGLSRCLSLSAHRCNLTRNAQPVSRTSRLLTHPRRRPVKERSQLVIWLFEEALETAPVARSNALRCLRSSGTAEGFDEAWDDHEVAVVDVEVSALKLLVAVLDPELFEPLDEPPQAELQVELIALATLKV